MVHRRHRIAVKFYVLVLMFINALNIFVKFDRLFISNVYNDNESKKTF